MPEHHHSWKRIGRGLAAILVPIVALSVAAPPQARAQDAYSCIDELSDDEVRYRIRYITDKLEDGKKHATRWRYTWMGLWLAGGAGMTYAAVRASKDASGCLPGETQCRDRNEANKFGWAYLAAGAYFAGLLNAVIPAPGVWGAKRIRKQDSSTELARREQLRYATDTLKKANGVQSFNAGAMGVAGSLIYGVVGGTVKATQWTGQTRGLTAAMYLGPPIVTGLQTATAPREGVEAWEAYRGIACSSKYYDRHEEGPEFDFSMNPTGGSFSVRF